MYRVKWREEKGGWRVSVCRDIGPHEYRVTEFVEGYPTVEHCCRAEAIARFRIQNLIIEAGGVA